MRDLAYPFDRRWTVAAAAQLACVLEATAPKVGNVHPGAAFADMSYSDFLESAAAIASVFESAANLSIGELVLQSVVATQSKVGLNTNLGTVLLFAPIAKATEWLDSHSSGSALTIDGLRSAIQLVLSNLNAADSRLVYEAIRAAKPGGIGRQSENDIEGEAPADLLSAMQQAAAVDAVARQYVNGFADLFDRLVPWFDEALKAGRDLLRSICEVQLRMLAEEPDGLIVRKCGVSLAGEIQSRAQRVVQTMDSAERGELEDDLDAFLRLDGHRRNPGTTADMIAAMLFLRLLLPSK